MKHISAFLQLLVSNAQTTAPQVILWCLSSSRKVNLIHVMSQKYSPRSHASRSPWPSKMKREWKWKFEPFRPSCQISRFVLREHWETLTYVTSYFIFTNFQVSPLTAKYAPRFVSLFTDTVSSANLIRYGTMSWKGFLEIIRDVYPTWKYKTLI